MGNLTAKDTRRISFDNTVTMNNALSIPKRMQDDDILEIEPLETILKCYEDNPHQPLLCSANVEAFCNCVASCYFEE
ncbi:unnamed protein product [Leptidea sinapis]|uniref:Uncharacterized protein n=1 Tax=Leptidea sinapis TaxID=189913 RepID=A0A5E4QTM7_9NEOP|nr:unnamed protein product [Leptidea sinapis]